VAARATEAKLKEVTMKMRAIGFVTAAVLSSPAVSAQTRTLPPVAAAPPTLRLVCILSYSLDENARRMDVEGEELITITYGSDGRAAIKRSDLAAEFRGRVTEDEIAGETTYDLVGTKGVRETIQINRYTGDYRRFYSVGDGSLMFVGECKLAERKF
jgi:hypothetical protein